MTAPTKIPEDPEQKRESVNALRVLGGLLMMVALLLYFFHLAESPMGHHILGGLSIFFAVLGVMLFVIGHARLSAMR
jgi:hypothetical protein